MGTKSLLCICIVLSIILSLGLCFIAIKHGEELNGQENCNGSVIGTSREFNEDFLQNELSETASFNDVIGSDTRTQESEDGQADENIGDTTKIEDITATRATTSAEDTVPTEGIHQSSKGDNETEPAQNKDEGGMGEWE